MKAFSNYVSELVLLIMVLAGIALVSANLSSRITPIINNSSEQGTISITYICYTNSTNYAYNAGSPFTTKMPVELWNGAQWFNTTYVPKEAIFRIHSDSPVITLITDKEAVVLKP